MTRMEFAVETHIGRMRKVNEDSYYIPQDTAKREKRLLFAIADGMGGHSAGEIASALAIKSLVNYLEKPGMVHEAMVEPHRVLKRAILDANRKIYMLGHASEKCANMGTTLTCALCLEDNWIIGHVGDSRGYLLRKGTIEQITQDHSLVEELFQAGMIRRDSLEYARQRHILSRALGIMMEEDGLIYTVPAQEGDILLLCSDGLYENIDMGEMLSVVLRTATLKDASSVLVTLSNDRRGHDNITVALARRLGEEGSIER